MIALHGVLDNPDLRLQVGIHVHPAVGQAEDPSAHNRDLLQEEVRQKRPGPQPPLLVEHGLEKRRRLHKPLHEQVGLAARDHFDGLLHSEVIGLLVDDLDVVEAQSVLFGEHADPRRVADQNAVDQVRVAGGAHRGERVVAVGTGDRDRHLPAARAQIHQKVQVVNRHRFVPPVYSPYRLAVSSPESTRNAPSASAFISSSPG